MSINFMRLGTAAALAWLVIAAQASAASKQDFEDCDAADNADRNIAGCTRLIDDPGIASTVRTNAYVERGLAWEGKGDLDRAIADFTAAIGADPDNAIAYNNRGLAKRTKGDLDGAIADFTDAIRIDPMPVSQFGKSHVNIYANRGLAWESKGDLDRAIADFDQAIVFDPRDADVYNSAGAARRMHGDTDRALADFNTAIRLDPRYKGAYYNRALIKLERHDLDGAIADLNQTVRLDPQFASAFYLRGAARYQGYAGASAVIGPEDLKNAIADYGEAIRLNPNLAAAYYARALALIMNGERDRAIADLTQAVNIAPYSTEYLAALKKLKPDADCHLTVAAGSIPSNTCQLPAPPAGPRE